MNQTAILIADLGYGDAGKGSIVDALTRRTGAHTVIRYNGGAQAAHNVVTPEGKHHTFAQFGSGTFIRGTRTYLSRFMITNPLAMLAEERAFNTLGIHDTFERTTIDRLALITTPFQQATNRIKELARGDARHGSCGMGIGETMSDWLSHKDDVMVAGDLEDRQSIFKKLTFVRDLKLAQLKEILSIHQENTDIQTELAIFYDDSVIAATADVYQYFATQIKIADDAFIKNLFQQPGTMIFEGAQGVLLDEWYGFFPYNTWSTTTFENANTLLAENGFRGEINKLGLTRAYATRHGAGPFVSEDEHLTQTIQDHHNGNNPWQRTFRVGHLDLVALRYALQVTGPIDGLVITNLDRMSEIQNWKICNQYRHPDPPSNLGQYFDDQDGLIDDIRLPTDPTDLIRQETLTNKLLEVQPEFSPHEKDIDSYLEHIATTLNIPIKITSKGVTADDKSWFD